MTDYSSLTVPKLKDECGSRGLVKSGNKAELIARLEEADASGNVGGSEEVVAKDGKQVVPTQEDELIEDEQPKGTSVENSTNTAPPSNTTSSLHPDPSISATLSTLPPTLQEEYRRRLARATKFGTPLSEVKVPAVEIEKPVKAAASSTAKPAVSNGKTAVVPAATTAAPSTSTAKPTKEPKIPIQAGPPIDEETLKRRRERFGEVAKDEPRKKVKADAAAVTNGSAEKKVEEEKVVDPEVAKRLQEDEERKRKRAERFGVAEPPASTTTAAATTTTTETAS